MMTAMGVATSAHADEATPLDTFLAARTRYAVAALGDSITDTRVGGGRYMAALSRRCPKSRFDAYGVGGQQTRHVRWRFGQDLFGDGLRGQAAQKPRYDHVIVLAGVNDFAGGLVDEARVAKTKEHLAWLYRTGRERGLAVVATTVPPWGHMHGEHDLAITRELNGWIGAQAALGNVARVVDVASVVSCDESTLCDAFRRTPRDGIHWNDAGHEAVAEALYRDVFADCE